MKSISYRGKKVAWPAVSTLVVFLSALACGLPSQPTATLPPPAVQVTPTMPVMEPTSTPAPDVTYEGTRFSYDEALASDVLGERVPAEEFMGGDTIPAHVRFNFNGYVPGETFHEPRIYVYPVGEFEASSAGAADIIARQRQFLADRPEIAPGEGFGSIGIPFLPLFNAGQMMRAHVAYLDFQNGTGVRFLTQYAQAFVPINNEELFYTFQGLTDDGNFYVAAVLPVSNPILPADGLAVPGGDYEAFANTFETYIGDIEQQLDAQDPSSFTPDLLLLDAMIESLEVGPGT